MIQRTIYVSHDTRIYQQHKKTSFGFYLYATRTYILYIRFTMNSIPTQNFCFYSLYSNV